MATNQPNNNQPPAPAPAPNPPAGYQNPTPAPPQPAAKPVAAKKKSNFWLYSLLLVGASVAYDKLAGPPEPVTPPQPTYTPNRDRAPLPGAVETAPTVIPAPVTATPIPHAEAIDPEKETIEDVQPEARPQIQQAPQVETQAAPQAEPGVITRKPNNMDRAFALEAVMAEVFRNRPATKYLDDAAQAETIRIVSERVGHYRYDQPLYTNVHEQRSGEGTYIAAAEIGPDRVMSAFICSAKGRHALSLFHATATPNDSNGYDVRLSDKVLHKGYLRGQLLADYTGKPSCDQALKTLDGDLNGTAETAAVNPARTDKPQRHTY